MADQISVADFARKGGVSLLGHVLRFAHGLLLMPLIIRSTDISSYGSYVLAIGAVDFLFGISSFGLGFRSARYLPTTSNAVERARLFWPQLAGHVAITATISAVLIAFGPGLRLWLLGPDSDISVALCVAYLMAYVAFAQTNAYLRYTLRMVACTLQSTAYVYLFVGAAIAMAWSGNMLGANTLFAIQIAVLIIISLPAAWIVFREIGLRIVWPDRWQLLQDIQLGFPIVLTFVVDTILSVGDRYLLRAFVDVEAVGYYAVGYAVGSLPLFFPRAIGMVLPQMLAVSVDRGRVSDARNIMTATTQAYLQLSVPYVIGCFLVGHAVIAAAVGPVVADHAWQVAGIVSIAQILFGMTLLLLQGLQVMLDTKAILTLNALAAMVNVGLNLLLLRWFPSPITVALTTLASYSVLYVGVQRRLRPELRPEICRQGFRRIAIPSAAMTVILLWAERGFTASDGLMQLSGLIVLGVTTYAATAVAHAKGNWRAVVLGLRH